MKRPDKSLLLLLVTFLIAFSSCEDSEDGSAKRNNWVWETMKTYYYWEDQISENDKIGKGNTVDFFNSLVYRRGEIDRWSFITDDLQELQNLLSGITKSTGYSFRPYYRDGDNSNDVVCIIEYVEPDSPADKAGLKRGDVIFEINGQKLNDQNIYDLAFVEKQELALGVVNADKSITELSPKVNVLAIQLQSNPILKTNVIEHDGKKIGYLAYTSFLDEYDEQLKAVFADFKTQGIDELVLDLRYNGGGSVSTAILLCSMIAPANTVGDVLLKGNYNALVKEAIIKEEGEESLIDRIIQTDENLDLSRIAILTTRNTASASEMIIYGLKPHMKVIQIGEQTHGKYYASTTFKDDDFYNWAMQPIIFRTENKDNSIDYNKGLEPNEGLKVQDLALVFDQQDVLELGDPNEQFLALAIQQLTQSLPQGAVLKSLLTLEQPLNTGTKLGHPLKYDMHIDIE
ncbi:MAG: S41 family peptidase [Carboxylicivirga sp.]|jgi:C-terminal processing protease CtpA/Prc|nr:S41 family peptidase [Carboxylicivirga sp.]